MCVCSVLASSPLTFRLCVSEIYPHMTDVFMLECVFLFDVVCGRVSCVSFCLLHLKGSHHIFFSVVVKEFYSKNSLDVVYVQAFLTVS